MKVSSKIWLIIAAALVILGGILFVGAFKAVASEFENRQSEMRSYELEEDFSEIAVYVKTADVYFEKSEDGKCKVVCTGDESVRYDVSAMNGTLNVVWHADERKLPEDLFGFSSANSEIRIYLPADKYGSLTVDGSTGDVCIPEGFECDVLNIDLTTGDVECSASAGSMQIETGTGDTFVRDVKADAIDIAATTGDVKISKVKCTGNIGLESTTGETELADVECGSLNSDAGTGSIEMTAVTAEDMMQVVRTSGDIIFSDTDAGEIYFETNTGDVSGTLLTDKIFDTETTTGDVSVLQCKSGGYCTVKTTTGDIIIDIK